MDGDIRVDVEGSAGIVPNPPEINLFMYCEVVLPIDAAPRAIAFVTRVVAPDICTPDETPPPDTGDTNPITPDDIIPPATADGVKALEIEDTAPTTYGAGCIAPI